MSICHLSFIIYHLSSLISSIVYHLSFIIVRLSLVLVLVFMLGSFYDVFAEGDVSGSAHLTYRSSEEKADGEQERSSQFSQFYNLDVSKTVTPKVAFSADLDVNVTDTDGQKTTRVSPDLGLDVTNEYFNANTGYRLTERGVDVLSVDPDEERRTVESWNANMSTKFEKYPKVRLSYNEDRTYDHLPIRQTDTKTTGFSSRADYAFRFLNFDYEYRNNTSEDFSTDSTQETDTNDARIGFRKSFLGNKVTSSADYSFTERKTETKTGGQEVSVDEKQRAVDGLHARDPLDPTVVELESKFVLVDGNKAVSTDINIGGAPDNVNQNIGVDLNFAAQVEKLFLYTITPNPDPRLPDPGFDVTSFTWAVYSSSDNLNWGLITDAADHVYNVDENRFEISFTKTRVRYFKVVNTTNDDSNDVFVTEIEAYDVTTFGAGTTTTDTITTETVHANLGYKPTDWLSFRYNFTQEQHKAEPETEETRRETHNVSGRVEGQLHKYLTSWAQYRRLWTLETEEQDRTTDTYLVHFMSSPLKTLYTDLSLNHTVSSVESETRSRSSSALFQVGAELREGADLDVDANITRSENLQSESDTTTKSLGSNLRLELTRKLTAEIEYNRNWTETEQPSGGTTGETSNGDLTVYWRPSHEFYVRGSHGIDRDEKTGEETSRQQFSMSWLMTEKMQFDMGYTTDRNDTVSSTYASDLSWNLSRVFTLRFGYDWSRQEADTNTETQTFTTDLSARF